MSKLKSFSSWLPTKTFANTGRNCDPMATPSIDGSTIRRFIQENAGRRRFSIFFEKDWFLDLMTINFKNAVSRRYVVQKSKVLRTAR